MQRGWNSGGRLYVSSCDLERWVEEEEEEEEEEKEVEEGGIFRVI